MSMLRINTNTESLFAQNNLRKLELSLNTSMQRLSSGLRINTAADDPVGVSILANARAQMNGYRVAQQNVQDNYTAFATADGAFSQIEDALMAARDITIRAANDATMTTAQITQQGVEYAQVAGLIDTISDNSRYGSKLLLDGSLNSVTMQVGANQAESLTAIAVTSTGASSTFTAIAGGAAVSFTTAANALVELGKIDVALAAVATERASIGSYMRLMSDYLTRNMNAEVNHAAVVSSIGDADMAAEVSSMAKDTILAQAATAVIAQANMQAQVVLTLLQ